MLSTEPTGTILAEETLVFTSCERNFVQLSNIQVVFSANGPRARSLQCFSYYAWLPFPSLMEFFETSALEVHLQLSIWADPSNLESETKRDVTLARHTRPFEFKYTYTAESWKCLLSKLLQLFLSRRLA